jgi:hypothetical protein
MTTLSPVRKNPSARARPTPNRGQVKRLSDAKKAMSLAPGSPLVDPVMMMLYGADISCRFVGKPLPAWHRTHGLDPAFNGFDVLDRAVVAETCSRGLRRRACACAVDEPRANIVRCWTGAHGEARLRMRITSTCVHPLQRIYRGTTAGVNKRAGPTTASDDTRWVLSDLTSASWSGGWVGLWLVQACGGDAEHLYDSTRHLVLFLGTNTPNSTELADFSLSFEMSPRSGCLF